jgi:hypothetical protein
MPILLVIPMPGTRETGRLVDVGPLVVPDPKAAKMIQPSKRALDDTAPTAETNCHISCDAWQAAAECGERASRVSLSGPDAATFPHVCRYGFAHTDCDGV